VIIPLDGQNVARVRHRRPFFRNLLGCDPDENWHVPGTYHFHQLHPVSFAGSFLLTAFQDNARFSITEIVLIKKQLMNFRTILGIIDLEGMCFAHALPRLASIKSHFFK